MADCQSESVNFQRNRQFCICCIENFETFAPQKICLLQHIRVSKISYTRYFLWDDIFADEFCFVIANVGDAMHRHHMSYVQHMYPLLVFWTVL